MLPANTAAGWPARCKRIRLLFAPWAGGGTNPSMPITARRVRNTIHRGLSTINRSAASDWIKKRRWSGRSTHPPISPNSPACHALAMAIIITPFCAVSRPGASLSRCAKPLHLRRKRADLLRKQRSRVLETPMKLCQTPRKILPSNPSQ